jgi:Uma2 family endonuclease
MSTVTQIGPADHGRPMTLEEFHAADGIEGYRYELIDGRLYVAPAPNLPENVVEEWIGTKLVLYSRRHPEVFNYVSAKARVFVPGRKGVTNPEPDRACYHNFPLHLPLRKVSWRKVSPKLVVEVISEDDPDKDLVRNVELYWQVPSIQEYWVLDARDDPDRPSMRVYRRGDEWEVIDLEYGDTYTTPLMPGFKMKIDPRS